MNVPPNRIAESSRHSTGGNCGQCGADDLDDPSEDHETVRNPPTERGQADNHPRCFLNQLELLCPTAATMNIPANI